LWGGGEGNLSQGSEIRGGGLFSDKELTHGCHRHPFSKFPDLE